MMRLAHAIRSVPPAYSELDRAPRYGAAQSFERAAGNCKAAKIAPPTRSADRATQLNCVGLQWAARFASLRKTHARLRQGTLPAPKYTYRVQRSLRREQLVSDVHSTYSTWSHQKRTSIANHVFGICRLQTRSSQQLFTSMDAVRKKRLSRRSTYYIKLVHDVVVSEYDNQAQRN
jgi:hypothetical protein